ncbi:MAG TPA: hypothetical protein VK988_05435 [Acidimicrobiales bacterium]|nr:hypothetical protein [Acidimicrobiales bacterium]
MSSFHAAGSSPGREWTLVITPLDGPLDGLDPGSIGGPGMLTSVVTSPSAQLERPHGRAGDGTVGG